jgi:cellulose biosynthesis protein BcsQ
MSGFGGAVLWQAGYSYDLKCAGSQAYLQLASEVIQRERNRKAA